MKSLFIVPIVLLFAACSLNRNEKLSINPESIPEVESLLQRLYDYQGEYILSGQHNYPVALASSTDSVISITGQIPVIFGTDFHIVNRRSDIIDTCIARYLRGNIITLMYHQGCPIDTIPEDVNPVRYKISEQEWKDLVTPGSHFNNLWLEDIDEVAAHLKVLMDYQIPVLWRPYHEMNGMWFWWGNQPGEEGIQKLWKQMYHRFTDHHKLNNLIWVWNANAPRDWENDEAYPYEWFFPGKEYADILAADIYKGDYKQSHHDELLELAEGKPIAMGEIGVAPDPSIFETQDQWSWFMMWANWPWKYNTPEQLNGLYKVEKVLNLEEYKALK